MKSSLKIIVAALALASAGGAFAQTATSGSTGSDMYFYAYDVTNASSFLLDLGNNYSNFADVSSTPLAVGGNANYQSFANAVTDNSIQWSVFAASSFAKGNLDVTSGAPAPVTTQSAAQIVNTVAGINLLMTNLRAASITTAQTTAGLVQQGAIPTNAENILGNITALGLIAVKPTNSIGSTVSFENFSNAKSFGNSTTTPFAGTWSFDGSNLAYTVGSVAAVPEPTSYMMMLGGLLMIGALAVRRRNSK